MLKLKLQYFDCLMQRTESLEKTLMLGKIEGQRRRGLQRMRLLDGITNSINKSEQTLGNSEGQWSLVCYSPWVCKESDTTSVQSLSHVRLFATPWTEAYQFSLSITNSQSLPMSIESVMPSNHLILCHPPLLLPSVFPSIRVFSDKSVLLIRWLKYWSFSFRISPSKEFRTDFL